MEGINQNPIQKTETTLVFKRIEVISSTGNERAKNQTGDGKETQRLGRIGSY